jgi:(2R)-3-sulfolactate dehydrogenase (NADP+)
MTELMRAIAAEPEVRLPGTRRLENRARAAREGLKITASLHAEINALIANPA